MTFKFACCYNFHINQTSIHYSSRAGHIINLIIEFICNVVMIQNNKKENLIIKLKHIILMQEALKVLPPVVCYEKCLR